MLELLGQHITQAEVDVCGDRHEAARTRTCSRARDRWGALGCIEREPSRLTLSSVIEYFFERGRLRFRQGCGHPISVGVLEITERHGLARCEVPRVCIRIGVVAV